MTTCEEGMRTQDATRLRRYRFSLGDSLRGPVELVLEIEATRPGAAISRLVEVIGSSYGAMNVPLPGLRAGESCRIFTNPAYFQEPELLEDDPQQQTIGG